MSEQGARNYRLLVVDDDEISREIVVAGLRSVGYKVITASGGLDALSKSANQWFDLAILDVNMPRMSGIELAWRLRETHGTPSIFLSGSTDHQTVEAAIAEGALGFLVKPASTDQIAAMVETALARAKDLRMLADSVDLLQDTAKTGHEVSMAVGILMERLKLSQCVARDLLASSAKATHESVEELADEIVNAQEIINKVADGKRDNACCGFES